MAGRLLELEFEVTDRLSRFLCGRTCDHNDAKQQCQHFLIPDIVGPPVKEELLRHRRLLQARLIDDFIQKVHFAILFKLWNYA